MRQGTLEIVIEEVLQGSYQTIWSFPLTNVKWHSVTWPYTMTTPYWSDFVPNSTFYRILRSFHKTFATGVACWQGTHTPPDTWSFLVPLGLAYVLLVKTNPFSELSVSFGTFSILLLLLSSSSWLFKHSVNLLTIMCLYCTCACGFFFCDLLRCPPPPPGEIELTRFSRVHKNAIYNHMPVSMPSLSFIYSISS